MMKPSNSVCESVEFSLIDDDDEILVQNTHDNVLMNDSDVVDNEEVVGLEDIDFNEAMEVDENVCNISIGVDEDVKKSASEDQDSEFDEVTGSLWIYPTNLTIRDYQFNIVKQALFKNTLVVLPTGLGKTFIAAVVMYNLYRWFPQGKIVFMAPTRPLVTQQMNACYNIMGIPEEDTIEMTGSLFPNIRRQAWRQKRVVFLTPQVMINDICRGSFSAKSIKCIVVDEAHKALRNHAYCQVIREVVKYTRQFRVLALSATPGSDLKTVQQVMNNLLISHIELRTEESIDIQCYTHERKIEKVVVPMGEELTEVRSQYIQVLNLVVQRLVRNKVLYSREATKYSQFVLLKARDEFRQNPPQNLLPAQFGNIEADFALAISLYHGFELLQLQSLKSLYNYLLGIVSGEKGYGRTRSELLKNEVFNGIMENLKQKFYNASSTSDTKLTAGHPKMQRLEEIVVEHFTSFKQKSLETRVMIFSQYRDSVQEIAAILNQHQPLVKVMPFIGQSSVGKMTKGYTQKEQLLVMKQFREGGYNTLVSTCVGEEGLDIGDVDLIICFDAHKSPIRLVQRMGRTGRKRKGRIVMLITEGKEEKIYHQSVYSKKAIHKAILNGAKSLQFYSNNPRLVPAFVNPQCHKMYISVSTKADKVDRKSLKARRSTAKLPDFFNKKMKASSENEFLLPEEFESIQEELTMVPSLAKCVPRPKCICLQPYKKGSAGSKFASTINFAEWMPWQNRLQKTFLVGHSAQSIHLVEDCKFIELQQTIGDTEDYYGLEMSRINQQKERKLEQSHIVSFFSTSCSRVAMTADHLMESDHIMEPIIISSPSDSTEDRATQKTVNSTPASQNISQNPMLKKINLSSKNISKGKNRRVTKTSNVNTRKHANKILSQSQSKFKQKVRIKSKEGGMFKGGKKSTTNVLSVSRDIASISSQFIDDDCIEIVADNRQVGNVDDKQNIFATIEESIQSDKLSKHKISTSFQPDSCVVPSPPDIAEVKYLFSQLTSRHDFANLDLEALIEEWTNSEKASCHIMMASLHNDLLPGGSMVPDEPAAEHLFKKCTQLNVNVQLQEEEKEPSHEISVHPPTSPLFKSVPCKTNTRDNEVSIPLNKSNMPVKFAQSLSNRNQASAIKFTQSLKADLSLRNLNQTPSRTSDKKLAKRKSNKFSNPVSSMANDDYLLSESIFSESLCQTSLPTNAGNTTVSSLLTYTQLMDCLDSSSPETPTNNPTVNNNVNQNSSSTLENQYRSKSLCDHPPSVSQQQIIPTANGQGLVRNDSCGFSVTESRIKSNLSFDLFCDSMEMPQFELGFDLDEDDDSEVIPSTPAKTAPLGFKVELKKSTSSSRLPNMTQSFRKNIIGSMSDNNVRKEEVCKEEFIDRPYPGYLKEDKLKDDLENVKSCFNSTKFQDSMNFSVDLSDSPEKPVCFQSKQVNNYKPPSPDLLPPLSDGIVRKTEAEVKADNIDINFRLLSPNCDEDAEEYSPYTVTNLPFDKYASDHQSFKHSPGSDLGDGLITSPPSQSLLKVKRNRLKLGDKRECYKELNQGPALGAHESRSFPDVYFEQTSTCNQVNADSKVKLATLNMALGGKNISKKVGLFDFDLDLFTDLKASTPVKPAGELKLVKKDNHLALTPIEKILTSNSPIKVIEEHKESFVIRRRKKQTTHVLTVSSDEDDDVKNLSKKSTSSKSFSDGYFDVCDNDVEDDFVEAEVHQLRGNEQTKVKKLKKNNLPTTKVRNRNNVYIEEEAQVSGEDNVSSDEIEDAEDLYEASFIDNDTKLLTSPDTDMRAVYLKSVKSPLLEGRFKLKYNRESDLHVDVYSQSLSEDHGNSEYEEDSFCVGSDDIESSVTDEESSPVKFTKISTKSGRSKKQGSRRIVKMCETSSDEEDKVIMTQEFSILDRKKAKKLLSSSEDERESTERFSSSGSKAGRGGSKMDAKVGSSSFINSLKVGSSSNSKVGKSIPKLEQLLVNDHKKVRSEECDAQTCLSKRLPVEDKAEKISDAAIVQKEVNCAEAVNFLLLEEVDWFADGDLMEPDNDKISNTAKSIHQPGQSTSSGHSFSTPMEASDGHHLKSKNKAGGLAKLHSKKETARVAPFNHHECDYVTGLKTVHSHSSSTRSTLQEKKVKSSLVTPINVSDISLVAHYNRNKKSMLGSERQVMDTEKQECLPDHYLSAQNIQLSEQSSLIASESSGLNDLTHSKDLSLLYQRPNLGSNSSDSVSSSTKIISTKHPEELKILVDSREISVAQNVISALRVEHGINVTAWQMSSCDYILSNYLAADRVLWSVFSNSSNSSKLRSRLNEMQSLYDRCVLIIEADPIKPGQEKSKKIWSRTKYVNMSLSFLLQTKIKIYFADSMVDTALLLSELCQIENRKGRAISVPTVLTPRQEEVMKFILSIPNVTVPQALNLTHSFQSLADFINSSPTSIQERGHMSQTAAQAVHHFLHYMFDLQLLPNAR